jgi:hypothetical protein
MAEHLLQIATGSSPSKPLSSCLSYLLASLPTPVSSCRPHNNASGFWASKALHAVAELGVADVIHSHVRSFSLPGPLCGRELVEVLTGSPLVTHSGRSGFGRGDRCGRPWRGSSIAVPRAALRGEHGRARHALLRLRRRTSSASLSVPQVHTLTHATRRTWRIT